MSTSHWSLTDNWNLSTPIDLIGDIYGAESALKLWCISTATCHLTPTTQMNHCNNSVESAPSTQYWHDSKRMEFTGDTCPIHVRASVLEISYGECYNTVGSIKFILTSKCRVWTQGRGWKVCRGWPRVRKPQDLRRRQVPPTDRSECHTSSLQQMDSPATNQNPNPNQNIHMIHVNPPQL